MPLEEGDSCHKATSTSVPKRDTQSRTLTLAPLGWALDILWTPGWPAPSTQTRVTLHSCCYRCGFLFLPSQHVCRKERPGVWVGGTAVHASNGAALCSLGALALPEASMSLNGGTEQEGQEDPACSPRHPPDPQGLVWSVSP